MYVNKKATGANNGTSWANAYTSLQDALASVCSGGNAVSEQTQIWVATDTYYPDAGIGLTSGDRELNFELCNKSAVYGGFNGTESRLSDRDIAANPTILSGDIDKNGVLDDNNSFGVVSVPPNTMACILDGFTVTLGNANKVNCIDSRFCVGGGLFSGTESSPTIRNVRFINNSTRGDGGGLFVEGSAVPLKISNCVFQQNSAGAGAGGGGGIYFSSLAKGTIINSLFAENNTTSGNLGGGGIYGFGISYLKIVNTTIAGNTAAGDNGLYGGAIRLRSPRVLTIKNTIMYGNSSGMVIVYSESPNPPAEPEISYSLIQGLDGTSGKGNMNGNTDPKFKDPGAGDYQLTPGSPVVNKGDPETGRYLFSENNGSGAPIDLAKNVRFYGPRIDLGAYELIHESALPVSLAKFNATLQENTTLLTWQTTEEINASHFEIQRSADARTFETIGTVKSKGRGEGMQGYSYADLLPVIAGREDIQYYRLRIVDLDDTFVYSAIVSIRRNNVAESINAILYPNPAVDRVTLESIGWNDIKNLKLYNHTGQEVPFAIDKPNRSLIVSHLSAGLYLLQVEKSDGQSQTYRMVIGR